MNAQNRIDTAKVLIGDDESLMVDESNSHLQQTICQIGDSLGRG